MATTEEQQQTSATTWAFNGADGGGPLVPADDGTPAPRDDELFDEPMTLQEHLLELRDRLIKSVAGVAVGMVGGFLLANYVVNYFIALVTRSCEQTVNGRPRCSVIAISPTEQIVVFFKIAFYLGIAVAMPILVYQFIRFLAPGLTRTEKRYLYAMLPFVILFFLLGIAFSSLVAIPNMMHFLLNFGHPDVANMISIERILSFFSSLSLWTGVIFEMPLVMFLLASLNIVSYQVLRKTRRYASVGLMIVAAIITPTPDPINMLIVWAPMYLLFELGILLARFARPLRRQPAAA
jgi:sec-independent protein translocase protein TatC